MAKPRRVLYCSTAFMLVSCLFLAASHSWASPKSESWQTGTLVSHELLVPADKKIQPAGCLLLPFTVYTVDAANYKYQFIGFPFSFSPGSATLAITFRIDSYDDDVYVRDPKTRHLIELKLFRKFPKLNGAESTPLPPNNKLKRRDWVTANIGAAEPVFLSPLALEIMTLPDSPHPLCSEDFIVAWEYIVQAQAKTYTFHWHGQNALNVTVNGANEFALGKKGSAYLIDDDGKERKVRLMATGKNILQ